MIWVALVLSLIAGYLVFWAGVISLIGFGGWKQIADRYPADQWPEEEGVVLSWQSASIGMSNYGNVLKAVITADGLYLRPVRMFAFNHPPVFIPWGSVLRTRTGFWGGLKLELDGGKALSIRGKMATYVKEALKAYELDELDEEDFEGSYLLDDIEEEAPSSKRTSESRPAALRGRIVL
ncbi:MAG: hypothetical protein IIC18_01915 [Bacteroidetes bacterium]|nr:hypothetical protein [Bacteroidota bacterium]